jgi:hypothetical protein
VNVDGTPITAVTLASAAGSAELKSLQHGEPIDWTTAYERGVATSVLQQLLWEVAQQDGTAVSQAAAEAYAQQQLRMYLDNQSPDRPPIAAGETAEDVFTSAGAVAGYRRHLSVDAEMAALAVRAYGSDYTPTQKDTAVFAWFASVLPSHLVRIEGMPSFDLATIVPSAA